MSKPSSKRPLHSPTSFVFLCWVLVTSIQSLQPGEVSGQCPGAKGVSSSATALACRLILARIVGKVVGGERNNCSDDDIEDAKKNG